MTDSKKDNQGTRTQYEPPRLFDLGGGVAHAAKVNCKVGGIPAGGKCQPGTIALYADCKSGSRAGNKCQAGIAASGGDCRQGTTAAGRCRKGGTAN